MTTYPTTTRISVDRASEHPTLAARWFRVARVVGYGLLTATLALGGFVLAATLVASTIGGLFGAVVAVAAGFGSAAAGPTVARIVVARVAARLARTAPLVEGPDARTPTTGGVGRRS